MTLGKCRSWLCRTTWNRPSPSPAPNRPWQSLTATSTRAGLAHPEGIHLNLRDNSNHMPGWNTTKIFLNTFTYIFLHNVWNTADLLFETYVCVCIDSCVTRGLGLGLTYEQGIETFLLILNRVWLYCLPMPSNLWGVPYGLLYNLCHCKCYSGSSLVGTAYEYLSKFSVKSRIVWVW